MHYLRKDLGGKEESERGHHIGEDEKDGRERTL